MGFMEPQMTRKQWWLAIDGNCGTDYIPDELFSKDVVQALIDAQNAEDYTAKVFALVKDYTENTEAYSAELIFGYGVRSSAPGYMDCTPWEVFTSKREALKAYNAEKRECEGEGDCD